MSFRIRFIVERLTEEEPLPEPLFGNVIWHTPSPQLPAAFPRPRSRSMDVPPPTTTPLEATPLSRSVGEEPRAENGGAASPTPPEHDSILFFAGNPEVDVSKGVLRLFRDNKCDSRRTPEGLPAKRSDLVCLLAMPAHYSAAEICRFLRAHVKHVRQMRVLRDQSPDRVALVMRMGSQEAADAFFLEYNGTQFNTIEPECCKVAFLAGVEFLEPRDAELLPPVNQHEMPSCPVCLERFEEQASGIFVTLCNHSFHCTCLAQWNSDASCPVCRYTLKSATEQVMRCDDCDTTDSLWICVVCGHVGCSRYRQRHANDHWKATGHTYSLELDTQRVWDYAGDGYVHRLIQNKSDGKVVELPSPQQVTDYREPEKIQQIVTEYNFLLTSQLEAQRLYFEDLLQKTSAGVDAHPDARQLGKANAQLQSQVAQLKAKMLDLIKENKALKDFNAALESDRVRWQSLVDRQAAEAAAAAKKTAELQEQVRDLMFFLEAQKAVAADETVLEEGGRVTVPKASIPQPPKTTPTKKGKKKR